MLALLEPGTEPVFPPLSQASPEGLLAVGGDLSPRRLRAAYRQGIFPWYSDDQPILWWAPDPRAVLFPDRVHVSRSLRRTLKRGRYRVSLDRAFAEVVRQCARPRPDQHGTWITPAMQAAYQRLHEEGGAHSVEVWEGERLAGGLYGVALGRVFFGESMFHRSPDASKVALVILARQLARWGYRVIDCQIPSAHLARLGAELIPRDRFVALIGPPDEDQPGPWTLDADLAVPGPAPAG